MVRRDKDPKQAPPPQQQQQQELSSQHQQQQQPVQPSADTSWSCLNTGMSGLFPMFDPDSYSSYFQNFPMGDSEMMGGDDDGGDDPLSFLMDYIDDTAISNPSYNSSLPSMGYDSSSLQDLDSSSLQSRVPSSLTGDAGSSKYYTSATAATSSSSSGGTATLPSIPLSHPGLPLLFPVPLQKPQPLQHPSPSSSTSSSPKPITHFLAPPAMLYHPLMASSNNTAQNHTITLSDSAAVQPRGLLSMNVPSLHPSSVSSSSSSSSQGNAMNTNSAFYHSILDTQLLHRNATPDARNTLATGISTTSSTQKSSPESSSSSSPSSLSQSNMVIARKLDPAKASMKSAGSPKDPDTSMNPEKKPILPMTANPFLSGIHLPTLLGSSKIPSISPALFTPHPQGVVPILVSSSDTDGDIPSFKISATGDTKGNNNEMESVKKVPAPKKGRTTKTKTKMDKPPLVPTAAAAAAAAAEKGNKGVLESIPPLNGLTILPTSWVMGATTTTSTTSSMEDTRMNTDPQQDDEDGPTEEDKTQSNRERNREHARNTRLRKKAYVENLKQTLDDLCKERDALLTERSEAAKTLVETNQNQIQVLLTFFALRAQCEKRRTVLASIMDENISCVFPITPYRSFPSSEVQVSKCQRTIMGIDGMIADAASLNVLLNSFVDRSRYPEGLVEYHYDVIAEEAVSTGNQMMVRWKLSTLNLESLGAHQEVKKYGMLCARFNSTHKIVSMEIMFDVMAFMLQLKQCAGNHDFTIVPNTLQTCQGFSSIPMVITTAERPYTIIQVNRSWESLTGWVGEDVVGKASCKILQGPQTDMKELEKLLTEIRFKRPARAVLVNYTKGMGQIFRNFINVYPLSTDSKITHYVGLTTHFERMPGGKRMDTESEISLAGPISLNGSMDITHTSSSNNEGTYSIVSADTENGKDTRFASKNQCFDNT